MSRGNVRERVYGTVRFHEGYDNDSYWIVKGEPHLLLRMKRIFGRINKHSHGEVLLNHNDEVARDLLWFMDRYPLRISPKSKEILTACASRHRRGLLRLSDMLGPKYEARSYSLALPPRDYQSVAVDVYLFRKSLLLADDLGLGKTVVAIASFTDPKTLPAIVVTLSGYMPVQWEKMIQRFAPGLTTHVLQKAEPYCLPQFMGRTPDVLILNYHKLSGWSETLAAYGKSVVFDECQELRRMGSLKYEAARHVARKVKYRLGMSATPIFNYGDELWNVVDVLEENALGTREEFTREWCKEQGRYFAVEDPRSMGSYLREQGIMLRRTREEVGRELPPLTKIVQRCETNPEALDSVKEQAATLAKMLLMGVELQRGHLMHTGEELSNVLRQATGIAKAPYAADFIRLVVESGETVVAFAWHRAVYDILLSKLEDLKPAMFTGSETPEKKGAEFERMLKGDTKVLIMSLRAGAGIDGLQDVCKVGVFVELDWAYGVMLQCVGRYFRDGQKSRALAYYLVAEDGADPLIAERLGLKREQLEGIRDPEHAFIEKLESDPGRAKELAEFYLKKHGIAIPTEKEREHARIAWVKEQEATAAAAGNVEESA